MVPPPVSGVVTVKFRLPGRTTLDAGRATVSAVELTKVNGTLDPFVATVESDVNPVPLSVRMAAVLMGPRFPARWRSV